MDDLDGYDKNGKIIPYYTMTPYERARFHIDKASIGSLAYPVSVEYCDELLCEIGKWTERIEEEKARIIKRTKIEEAE